MTELAVETEIAAPPHVVWKVLTDFPAYRQWHPYQTISGPAQRFAIVIVSSQMIEGQQRRAERAMIWKFEPEQEFELWAGNPFWYSARRFFILAPSANGTLLRFGVKLTGVFAWWRFCRDSKIDRMRPYLQALSIALKLRCTATTRRK